MGTGFSGLSNQEWSSTLVAASSPKEHDFEAVFLRFGKKLHIVALNSNQCNFICRPVAALLLSPVYMH